ncbi:type I restriction endonuclease subunit R [Kiloniella sp.]|uniref:type I restriction endonuclease subunit R n=1 Tax=Kiloniella sp. TaxID=1938587 RepID=UPI003A8EAB38
MGGEWVLAEKPTIECLRTLGYKYLDPEKHKEQRDGQNHVLLRPVFIKAIQKINGISEEDAQAAYLELISKTDNEEWSQLLRGNYSRTVPGKATKQTIKIIDFLNIDNNTFTVTSQLYVKSEQSRKPDVVVYVNGIPLVIIEAKSPLNYKDKTGEAFEQIKQYERDIPRLFYSNVFNILTDGTNCLYGSTGSPSKFFASWKDPWPRQKSSFDDELSKGLWCLLEPSRLLDLLAHFVVFEKTEEGVVKKICRYQQFRAVNKIVARVVDNQHRQGLVWHTQGSGKSLTMVFAALKLKMHYTIESAELTNPNILVLTDRIDLDDQISKTFQACGLPNPDRMNKVSDLQDAIHAGADGLVVLSTIFKFQGSEQAIDNSEDWIVMIDECHRTQEKDLGAYLRATLPKARFFGFTGTPIKKDDKNTYQNFGVEGEGYLDKYGIDDAVADGATVPIYYTGRKTDWHIDEAKIDILFDNWFADLPEDKLEELKSRGVSLSDLVKHPKRIELIAYDIWTHFKAYARPDGYKAQIVCFDREAIILYKRALDKVIAEDLGDASLAASMSACVFSANQEDNKPSEDKRVQDIRKGLVLYYLDRAAETDVKALFGKKGEQPEFLIVCDKLLTGFDAPIESVMYLDKPLKEHTLLQAIARTNRVADPQKKSGLIVDYIGVSKNLDDALSSYRSEDVQNAMRDLDDLRSELRAAHATVIGLMKGLKRGKGKFIKPEFDAFVKILQAEDDWFTFRRKAREFIGIYEALSPDPAVLSYTADLKWIAAFLQYATQVFEKKEAFDHKSYSGKIREMLDQHLDATGISTTVKLRHITDPEFWDDFDVEGMTEDDLKTAAIRKTTELRKMVSEKVSDNPLQYQKFSDRLLALLEKLDGSQISWGDKLKMAEELAKDIDAESSAHENTGMSENTYGIYKILEALKSDDQIEVYSLENLASEVTGLYEDEGTAPTLWQDKPELRKGLRQQVRKKAHGFGLTDWKQVPERVEEFAVKHMSKRSGQDRGKS